MYIIINEFQWIKGDEVVASSDGLVPAAVNQHMKYLNVVLHDHSIAE